MKQGYTGDDLKQYQEKLGITADGIFGKQTDKAVRDFQTKNNLTVDGIIGKNTIGAFSKQNNSMDVNELGNVPDMSGLPTAPEPTMRKTPDFNNLLKTAQDFYKQDEVTTLERERQQGIVTALQGQGGRADLLASLGDEAGLGTKREAMTAASGKLERLQAEEDTLYDQMRQEESEGRGLRTTSAYQGESTRRARRIGIDKRYAAADLLATQGDYQGALEQVNQAVEYEFADRADMLTAQKQQLE
ncbi:MAG: peptidoglycan-binding domain-containing protein [Nanoarchaeota archaeon]|nr:peptidoglycan-binding domain-containing protein [Nanoarchaeota archaeon]